MKRIPIAIVFLLLVAGCSVNEKFVYKPSEPVADLRKLPVRVAILPFTDGTEDFTSRGSIFTPETLVYNLAKAGISSQITALTPELWAKGLADEMAASGAFRSVRFLYSSSELVDEDFYIEGTVEKAYVSGAWNCPNQFALRIRVLRRGDHGLAWDKAISRTWVNTPDLYEGCGTFSLQCMVDRGHAKTNEMLQGLFSEAAANLAGALAPLSQNRPGENNSPSVVSPAPPSLAPLSVDDTIDSILKGK